MILSDTGGTTFEQPPIGSHAARCIAIIDLGTQKNVYEGETSLKRQVIIRWELCNEPMSGGDSDNKPFTVSKFYTASLNEKASLRKDLASWRTRDFTPEELKGFDLRNIIGKTCMLAVGLSEKGKAKVSSVMAPMKGMTFPEQSNEGFHFSLNASEFSESDFESLSKGFKDMVMLSPEYAALKRRAAQLTAPAQGGASTPGALDDLDDSIPF
jgi:hypothetical protein